MRNRVVLPCDIFIYLSPVKKKKKLLKKHRGAENAGSVTFRRLEVEIYLCGMRVARCDNMEIYLHHLCSTFISWPPPPPHTHLDASSRNPRSELRVDLYGIRVGIAILMRH